MSGPLADLALARRLERTEGTANRNFVESRARVRPESGSCWMEAGGAYAMFDGPDSPLTQTFGLGLFETPTAEQLEAIESFFRVRGAAVHHETSPIADPALVPLLVSRGYHPIEYTSVLYRSLSPESLPPSPPSVRVVPVQPRDEDRYVAATIEGWSETPGLSGFLTDVGRVQAEAVGYFRFLAEIDDDAVATGAMFIDGDVALLAGASTVPRSRGKGAQLALLAARLRSAVAAGCTVAMMGAAPGSGSQRNAERQGFRIAYTRIKWRLA